MEEPSSSYRPKLTPKPTLTMVAVIAALAFCPIFMVVRNDQISQKLGTINQTYIPALKGLNLLQGKFAAYRRSVEQYTQFQRWGEKGLDLGHPRFHIRRIWEGDLRALERHQNLVSEVLLKCRAFTDREPGRLAELAALVHSRHFSDAAKLFVELRREELLLQNLIDSSVRKLETAADEKQWEVDHQLRNTTAVVGVILMIGLSVAIGILLRMRRWMIPMFEWTKVASDMAKYIARAGFDGLKENVKLPVLTAQAPPEIVLMTREFGHMATTIVEHQKTIQTQKAKLESLNDHLVSQNKLLRKLGSLNERILNSFSAGVVVIDSQSRIEQYNDRFREMFRLQNTVILGGDIEKVLSNFPEEERLQWNNAGSGTVFSRVRVESEDGTDYFDIRVEPLSEGTNSGSLSGHVMSFENVTSKVVAEERLAHAERLAMAGQMSAQVAHEVRNPLNAMMLQLEMLEEDLPVVAYEKMRPRIQRIVQEVERLERITENYLNVGLQQKRGLKQERLVDVNHLIEEVLSFCSADIQARGVTIKLDLQASHPFIMADADRLYQVLLNLIQNALESMESGAVEHPQLTVSNSDADHKLMIAVKDNGPGLERTVRARLFEPFVTSKSSGHGLGLSLSRQACIDHGGDLQYKDCENGLGACFEVSLPC